MLKGIKLRRNLILFCLSVSMVCLVFSKFVLSMSLIGVLLLILFSQETEDNLQIGLNRNLFSLSRYKKNIWPFTGFIIYYFWILLSYFWSSGHIEEWFDDSIAKLAIVGISFMFIFLPRLTNVEIRFLHLFFYTAVTAAALMILFVYWQNFDHITLRIGSGRPIPTPIDHVRFSMMVSYACLSSFAFFFLGLSPKRSVPSWVFLLWGSLFFAFTHVLAVRSGLVLLYSGIVIGIIYFVLRKRAVLLGFLGLAFMLALPFLAYQYVPSFKNKVLYTKYDLEQSILNRGNSYSDGDRLNSIKTGLKLWEESPVLGLGAGDYKLEMKNFYSSQSYAGRQLLPHNQWIRTGMAYGIIGVLLLLLSFLIAFFEKRGYSNLLLLLILQIFFLSFMVESNMERYYALVFFMLFVGLASLYKVERSVLR